MSAIYDQIGNDYDTTRRVDSGILSELRSLLDIQKEKEYLDIACGTGNYTVALSGLGGKWYAFDQSERMVSEARTKSSLINWSQFDVGEIGFKSDTFDGAVCTLAIHHFPDLALAFSEVSRVLKPEAKFIVFTATPEQMRSYWLCHYFPVMMERSCEQMPSLEAVEEAMRSSGLMIESTKPFFITSQLQDFFLYSGKQRPEMYLSARVRAGISSFCSFCSEAELENGLSQLNADIQSGSILGVMDEYQSGIGDYLFISAAKQSG
ncbi:MAG: class I SAM-dependent methyltransferase [Opitutaceae bacterium]|nr:class I SAM-dependent methyltransferase [Opitutaceae bacterium]